MITSWQQGQVPPAPVRVQKALQVRASLLAEVADAAVGALVDRSGPGSRLVRGQAGARRGGGVGGRGRPLGGRPRSRTVAVLVARAGLAGSSGRSAGSSRCLALLARRGYRSSQSVEEALHPKCPAKETWGVWGFVTSRGAGWRPGMAQAVSFICASCAAADAAGVATGGAATGGNPCAAARMFAT